MIKYFTTIIIVILTTSFFAQTGNDITADYNVFDGNNIFMWAGNNGRISFNPVTSNRGMLWLNKDNSTIPVVYSESPVLGYKYKGNINVHTSTYASGFKPGYIKNDGTIADSSDSLNIVYKLIKNWQLIADGARRAKYQFMYDNWPAERGAPYIDVNGNGQFDRGIDEPQIIGDQTLWWSSHTADSMVNAISFPGYTDSMEIQTTVWGENEQFPDVVFKKFVFINKNTVPVTDMYFGYWSDQDIANASDDFGGVDTTYDFSYVYNGDSIDVNMNEGEVVPAVGYVLLEGPAVEGSATDTARFNGRVLPGYKNLRMTSHFTYINATQYMDTPFLGDYEYGTLTFYNNLSGLYWTTEQIHDPITNEVTKFVFAGDPVAGTGWYEGFEGWPGGFYEPGDRKTLLSSGPFNMAPGDTQSVVIATAIASGSDHINSIKVLRDLVKDVKMNYENNTLLEVKENEGKVQPGDYNLAQNYPNPFNPSTKINFTLPETENVKIEIFDILGRKVSELLNTEMSAGTHSVMFNGEGLSSGMYIYQLTSGTVMLTKKMMLLK